MENPAMATKKPKGLGLGLEALLGPTVRDAPSDVVAGDSKPTPPQTLPLDDLQAGKYQPRTRMDEGALFELAESIKAQGVMQPILVRRIDGAGRSGDGAPRYEVIAGERRVRAARLAGLAEVPVLVRDVPDEAAAAMALIENIQREDLNPLEEAQGLKRLTDEFGLTHEEAARSVGRSRSAASNLLRLLNLADPVQQLLLAGDLDMGHARALLALEGAEQILVANEVVARKLSVRDAEVLVARRGNARGRQARSARPQRDKPRDLQRIEQVLSDTLAAAVDIRVKKRTRRGEQGEVAIQFGSLDELNGLLQKLGLPAS
jgi:ParB family transcriptional regulator, chromosome partitioning protein